MNLARAAKYARWPANSNPLRVCWSAWRAMRSISAERLSLALGGTSGNAAGWRIVRGGVAGGSDRPAAFGSGDCLVAGGRAAGSGGTSASGASSAMGPASAGARSAGEPSAGVRPAAEGPPGAGSAAGSSWAVPGTSRRGPWPGAAAQESRSSLRSCGVAAWPALSAKGKESLSSASPETRNGGKLWTWWQSSGESLSNTSPPTAGKPVRSTAVVLESIGGNGKRLASAASAGSGSPRSARTAAGALCGSTWRPIGRTADESRGVAQTGPGHCGGASSASASIPAGCAGGECGLRSANAQGNVASNRPTTGQTSRGVRISACRSVILPPNPCLAQPALDSIPTRIIASNRTPVRQAISQRKPRGPTTRTTARQTPHSRPTSARLSRSALTNSPAGRKGSSFRHGIPPTWATRLTNSPTARKGAHSPRPQGSQNPSARHIRSSGSPAEQRAKQADSGKVPSPPPGDRGDASVLRASYSGRG